MPAEARNFHVADEIAGLALSAALRGWLPGVAWSRIHKLIEHRHVQINGNLCTDRGRRLRAGDVIKLWDEPRQPPPQEHSLRIPYSDAHLIVVEKPAGVTSTRHSEEQNWSPRRRQLQPTLDEMLQRRLTRQTAKGAHTKGGRRRRPPRVRAVHRLDRETSGLMVFARSAPAEQRLVQMFRKHQVQRAYWAICLGDVEAQTFESFLVRDRGDGRRGSTKLPGVGRRAVTHVRPLEKLEGYTLVECRLETGRTHQIRIHLAEAGHPVCGDKVYGKPLFGPPIEDPRGAQRQALHAFELAFDHPITGEPLRFEMPMPTDMQRLLQKLRKGKG